MSLQESLSADLSPAVHELAENLFLVYKAAVSAYYNSSNCRTLVVHAAQLLASVRSTGSWSENDALITAFNEALLELQDFFLTFSQRQVTKVDLQAWRQEMITNQSMMLNTQYCVGLQGLVDPAGQGGQRP